MADKDSRAGKRYDSPEIIDWVARTHGQHDAALAQAFAVPEGIPAIQVGPSEGRFLHVLMKLARAKKVVEVGTLVGYSAIQMARALPADGHLWSIEYEQKHADVARRNLATAGLAERVTVVVGAGRDKLPTLEGNGPFDAVFIDADKENYAHYGRWAVANLRAGGLVIGDNTYLFGELLDDSPRGRAMREFHELVAAACDSTSVPTPDGMVVGVKR
jgi:caffeoyl-CoA O-methyltransferase